ncbi:MAG: 2-oxoacid:acceptor oxidoreductase family protein [Eubacteriales bacterium]|nr:2-oxoacid:acceptor oxidoreductase family protein [Eubacteriales bacterium]
MTNQLIIAGFGGQGVLLMGQLLAYSGMLQGKEVSWLPSYGPEMRGGSANCHVVISDEPVGSPRVEEATAVIAMNYPSMKLFEKSLVPGGLLLYNSSLIEEAPERSDIRAVAVPCNDIAAQLGNSRVANMAMLGAFIGASDMFDADTLVEALRHKLGPAKEKLIPLNRQAIETGIAAGRA